MDHNRKLLEVYSVTPMVCPYRTLDAAKEKLKKRLRKADSYYKYLQERVIWTDDALSRGRLPRTRDMLLRKHRQFLEEARQFPLYIQHLNQEIERIEEELRSIQPCGRCRACLPTRRGLGEDVDTRLN